MGLDDFVTEIAVEFLNDMILFEDGNTRFDKHIWEWKDLFEGCGLEIVFDFRDETIPCGVYVDLIDINRGDTVVGSGHEDGITPEAIGKAIKTARDDFLWRERLKGGDK